MAGIRSALALLVFLGLLVCPTIGSHVSKASTTPIDGLITCQPSHLTARLLSSQLERPRNVSQFTQFRYRMKSVLVETTNPMVDESDLGPVVIPSRLISLSPIELTFRPLATVRPLRC
jgi:hypothetical protein